MASMPLPGDPSGYGPGGVTPPAPAGRKPWLWALGGAVAASAVWAGAVFATGGFGGDPDPELAGYAYTDDLCASSDFSAVTDDGDYQKEEPDDSDEKNPEHFGTEHAALDSMNCNIDFEPANADSDDYSSAWLYSTAQLHKKTDPGPEFEATYRAYEDQKRGSYRYRLKEIKGLGDEAYLVTQVDKDKDSDDESDGEYMILGVRDGWLTYSLTWSEYVSSSSSDDYDSDYDSDYGSDSDSDEHMAATPTEVEEMLKKTAEASLKKLRQESAK
ncbi:hypothetical protein IHE55_08310 [Streptomyces pactum]|uniref:Calcium-binding protein n=2 Tax=Streptomyces pactum TaxID=68249 RepID=A0ABS0NHW9_9ACTN|nr:hypothetical protein [Streptomyces pactum]